jgi:hypothetical protein
VVKRIWAERGRRCGPVNRSSGKSDEIKNKSLVSGQEIPCRARERGESGQHVPTVYREDYLLPLKALSSNADAKPFVAAMTRIQSWSAAFDHGVQRDLLRARLAACHAFEEDLQSYRLVFPEQAG